MKQKDLNKYQNNINGMMKELTCNFDVDNPEIRLSGEPTEVFSDVDAFNLNPARKVTEYYGNKIYLDRVRISPDIKFNKLRQICTKMFDDYTIKYSQSKTFLMSFKVPGNNQEWCRQTEAGDLEIRLYCKFEQTA